MSESPYGLYPLGVSGGEVELTTSEFLANPPGKLMQYNKVGVMSLALVYMGLGHFRVIAWDDREKPGHGWIVAVQQTLENAEGLFFALVNQCLSGDYGDVTAERSETFKSVAADLFPKGKEPLRA
jgi:hypothetical protein